MHLCKYLAAYLVSAGSRLDSVVVVLHRSASLSGRCHLLYTPIHLGVAARLSVTRLDVALVLVDAITDPSTTSPTNRFGNTTVDSAPNRFANRFLHTLSVLVARRNVEHVAAHAAKSRSESNLAAISTTTSRGNSFARTRSLSRVVLVVETTSSITTSSPSIARASNRLDRRAFVVVVVSVPTASVVVPVVPSASRARSFAASVATPSSTANPRAVEHTGSPEVAAAYSLFTEIASVGVIAGQILEILTNPNIPSFSDETTWINPEEASRLYDDEDDEDEPPSDFAREAKLMTAAIRACRRNRPRDIEELVEVKGLYVDARDETSGGQTLLMIAAANGNKSTCKKLLLLGAAPNARDGHGRTAVDVAYQYNHFELAEYLRVHGVPRGDAARGFADSASPSKYRSKDSEKPRMAKFQNNDAFAHGDGHAVDDRSSVPSAPPMQSELVVAEVRSARVATDESELLTPD